MGLGLLRGFAMRKNLRVQTSHVILWARQYIMRGSPWCSSLRVTDTRLDRIIWKSSSLPFHKNNGNPSQTHYWKPLAATKWGKTSLIKLNTMSRALMKKMHRTAFFSHEHWLKEKSGGKNQFIKVQLHKSYGNFIFLLENSQQKIFKTFLQSIFFLF